MECHHRYLCSYREPRLDTIRNNQRKQLLFHDLSTWSAPDSIWFSAIAAYILAFQNPCIELLFDKTGCKKQWIKGRRQMKAAFKLKKKQGVLISTYLVFKPTSLFWAHEVNTSRKPRPTDFRNPMNMGLRSLSRSNNGQNPNRSGRSSVSTRMLLLPRSKNHLLRLDLESHREWCVRSPNRCTNYVV